MVNSHLSIEEEYRLWVLLHQTRDAVLKIREYELEKTEATVIEAGVMYIITQLGKKATPATISKYLVRQHHTVTALLKRMEKKGLIRRTANPKRKNNWIIELTEKGEKAYRISNSHEGLHEVMSEFTDEEKAKFDEFLNRLRDRAIRYMASLQVEVPPFP